MVNSRALSWRMKFSATASFIRTTKFAFSRRRTLTTHLCLPRTRQAMKSYSFLIETPHGTVVFTEPIHKQRFPADCASRPLLTDGDRLPAFHHTGARDGVRHSERVVRHSGKIID